MRIAAICRDALSDHNWQVQDLTGVVTAYNVLYYQALRNAAVMARAVSRQDEAAGFERLSSLVQTAINSTLFNATAIGKPSIFNETKSHLRS